MRERESESAVEWKQNTKSIKSFSSQLSWCTYYRRKWIQVLTTVLVILCGWFFLSLFIFTQKNAKLGSLSHFDELNIFCGYWSFSWLCLSLSLPNRPRTSNIKRQKTWNERKAVKLQFKHFHCYSIFNLNENRIEK